jgi:aminoglycoside phosphotransferase (APT) family kinase protein
VTTSWEEASRALRATTPDDAGAARLAAVLGEPVEVVGPLHGGVASSTHELRTPTRRLVLKRFVDDEEPPEAWALEWTRLGIARHAPVPTPEPIAYDPDGTWFGRPALLMSHLPGAVVYPPAIEALACTLAALHTTVVGAPTPEALHRPGYYAYWKQTAPVPDGVLDALATLLDVAPTLPTVLCHSDYHPGNVLVTDGEVTGVVDWSSARFAPRGFDVGLMRCDLAIEPGGDAPARFLAAYEAAAGVSVEHLHLFDAFGAARAIDQGSGWVDAWTDAGIPMTVEQIHDRAWAFGEAALS